MRLKRIRYMLSSNKTIHVLSPRYTENMGWTHIAPRIEFAGNPELNDLERANIIRKFRCLFEEAELLFIKKNFKKWKV